MSGHNETVFGLAQLSDEFWKLLHHYGSVISQRVLLFTSVNSFVYHLPGGAACS